MVLKSLTILGITQACVLHRRVGEDEIKLLQRAIKKLLHHIWRGPKLPSIYFTINELIDYTQMSFWDIRLFIPLHFRIFNSDSLSVIDTLKSKYCLSCFSLPRFPLQQDCLHPRHLCPDDQHPLAGDVHLVSRLRHQPGHIGVTKLLTIGNVLWNTLSVINIC